MTSLYLQKCFEPYLKRNGFDFIFHNKFLFKRESDMIACKNFELYEYEFKIGESYFRKDIKKDRHQAGRLPNFFFYVVSDISVINGNYHEYAGIYVHSFDKRGDNRFNLIKQPQKIREESITLIESYSLLKKIYNG